jgi:hypothetical protein
MVMSWHKLSINLVSVITKEEDKLIEENNRLLEIKELENEHEIMSDMNSYH